MARDRRYVTIRNLIQGGYIKSFREIFDTLPKSVIAKDLGMNNTRFTRLIENVEQFTLEELFLIAGFLEIDHSTLLGLILQQYLADKDKKIKKVKTQG